MTDISGNEETRAKEQRESTPYEKMPEGLQQLWDERYFNASKLRTLLLSADAVLTWALMLWVGFAMLMGVLYGYSPSRFPLHIEYSYSLGVFFIYFALVGFARRQTEKYIVTLRAQRPGVKVNDLKRPFLESEDPKLARIAFGMRKTLGMPRRGLGQYMVVIFQFLAGFVYVGNYALYVLWKGNIADANYPTILWVMHAVITSGGLLIIIKYGGFLVDTRRLLVALENIVGTVIFRQGSTTHTETVVSTAPVVEKCSTAQSQSEPEKK